MLSDSQNHTKIIFVTGGVISSLGKGIVAASIGALLETRGLSVVISKADPYLNVDPGTMNPLQHGEVFVTDDGAETDLDLGHYERFISRRLQKKNAFTTGQVYDTVLSRERQGGYLGGTVQVVPHITDQIKSNICYASQGADIAIVEIGGTVGDIESLPFLEAIRQLRWERGSERVAFCHVTLVPYVQVAMELKTKPTQHSVRDLRQLGIQPDLLICRSDRALSDALKAKIALFCNVDIKHVFESLDTDSIYRVPLAFHEQQLDHTLIKHFNIWAKQPDLSRWRKIENSLNNPKGKLIIGIIGKYTDLVDSYKSIIESLVHAGIAHLQGIHTECIDAESVNAANYEKILSKYHAIVVPGGFGDRGMEGKMLALTYQRENKRPLLAICLGMQLAVIEIARHLIGITQATSQEFDPSTQEPVVCLMDEQRKVVPKGGTMRLGAYPCVLKENSLICRIYGEQNISERHRHRYEFNSAYKQRFEEHNVIFSGLSPSGKLVEAMELSDHPFYLGCQFHPELKSRPTEPHPIFCSFIQAAMDQRDGLST
ncbi:MAG: CTP synthase [Proteobacteria bacterium]|nr:CTP synthase [Pseudomonadota bacterium]